LYKTEPHSKTAIKNAAGYAVFDNMGVHVLLLSTARGSGLAVNNKTKQETFMKMVSVGGGLGLGVKDYDVVFVFETKKALDQFLDSGWSGSGQAEKKAERIREQCKTSPAVDPAGYEIRASSRTHWRESIFEIADSARQACRRRGEEQG